MKYIRTKEGTVFFGPIDTEGTYKCTNLGGWKEIKPFFGNLVIMKQSDNPKEICDCFIYDFYDKHFRCYYSPNTETWVDYETGADLHTDLVNTIKGAIWTEKGLIYVMKMNDDWMLELL